MINKTRDKRYHGVLFTFLPYQKSDFYNLFCVKNSRTKKRNDVYFLSILRQDRFNYTIFVLSRPFNKTRKSIYYESISGFWSETIWRSSPWERICLCRLFLNAITGYIYHSLSFFEIRRRGGRCDSVSFYEIVGAADKF